VNIADDEWRTVSFNPHLILWPQPQPMKYFLISLAFIAFHYSIAGHKIELSGRVATTNKSSIAAKVSVKAQNFVIDVETDSEGKFSTIFSEVSQFTITILANGFEKQEQTLTVPPLKSDSIIQVSANLVPLVKLKLNGMVFDKKTGKPVTAEFDLYMDNDILREDVEITANGKYSELLTEYGWYIINVSAKGYLNYSDTIWVMDCKRTELHRDYYLTALEAGLNVRLKNIQFNFGKTSLHPDSYAELNNVAELLTKNQTLKLEIGGHTDSDGPDDYNLWLSQSRAQAVVEYLIKQGANSDQLIAKGYGESKPIDNRETLAAKSTNRRVEFTVLQN
jgi:outer membrane protein OmpA-like peptidoglycan-associated protein